MNPGKRKVPFWKNVIVIKHSIMMIFVNVNFHSETLNYAFGRKREKEKHRCFQICMYKLFTKCAVRAQWNKPPYSQTSSVDINLQPALPCKWFQEVFNARTLARMKFVMVKSTERIKQKRCTKNMWTGKWTCHDYVYNCLNFD